jgi:hypothetical protein
MTARPPVITPMWPRPRGRRLLPPARARATQDPYGAAHRAIRRWLLGQLAATGPWPCPICGEDMHAWMGRALHLHHSDPAAKLAGLPGDQLAHGACNIREGAKLGAAITNGTAAAPATVTVRQSRIW